MATKPICKLWNYVIQFSSITLQATVIPSFHFLQPKFVVLGDFLDLKDLITSSQYKEKREMESYLALVTFFVQAIYSTSVGTSIVAFDCVQCSYMYSHVIALVSPQSHP